MNQDIFLQRVRASLRQGEGEPPARPSSYVPPEPASQAKLTEQFSQELEAVGGQVHHASSLSEARHAVLRILAELGARRVVRADTPELRKLDLDNRLKQAGIEVTVADLDDETRRGPLREASFVADAGITFGDYGVAETGTLALLARRGQGRVVSLLPPVHIAVLRASDIVAELATLMDRVGDEGEPPSALTFITGPSRTGDIELVLTVGVHGPKELHVVLVS